MFNTYNEAVIFLEEKPKFYKSVYKDHNVNSAEELYLHFNNVKQKCKFCGEEAKFISFKKGYSDICSNKDCVSKKLSEKVTQSYKNISEEDKKAKNEKIKNSVKNAVIKQLTFEDLKKKYPDLKDKMSNEEIIEFYNKHNKKTNHISYLLIKWGLTYETLYKLSHNEIYCQICGKETPYNKKSKRYDKMCSKECHSVLRSNSAKKQKGNKLSGDRLSNFLLKMKEKNMINIEDINEKYWKENFIVNGLFDEEKAYKHHNVSKMTIYRYKLLFNIENSNIQRKCVTQKNIFNFIKENYEGLVLFNDRKILKPFEIDIYIPELKFGIEFNGILSHTSGKHSMTMYDSEYSNYTPEYDKLLKAEELGITLFNIDELSYMNKVKRDIWHSMILNKLNKIPNKIYARKCIIKEVQSDEANKFLFNNHIQSTSVSKIRLGLYYNNELVFLLTFGKPRFNKEYEYELIRSCSKKNTSVVGGFSRLIKWFTNNVSTSIISYADRRWSKGDIYRDNNFIELDSSGPAMFYYYKGEIINRMSLQKHKLKHLEGYDDNKTAKQILYENGYRKGYTCGNRKFTYKITK